MKLFSIIFLIIPAFCVASPQCKEGNAIPDKQKKEITVLGIQWAQNAIYCNFGIYQVLAPLNKKSDSIIIFKEGKIFVLHQKGFGINIFQDYGKEKSIPSVTVQDWNKDGIYERLDYSIIDNKGNIIGTAQDKTMNGKVNVFKFK